MTINIFEFNQNVENIQNEVVSIELTSYKKNSDKKKITKNLFESYQNT